MSWLTALRQLRGLADSREAIDERILSTTPYNEKQASYDSEVTAAMAGEPDGLYLNSYPVDGAIIARAWIAKGGVQKFLLINGMNSPDFINAVGKRYLNDAFGTSSATNPTPSTQCFNADYKAFSGIDPDNPAADMAKIRSRKQ